MRAQPGEYFRFLARSSTAVCDLGCGDARADWIGGRGEGRAVDGARSPFAPAEERNLTGRASRPDGNRTEFYSIGGER